MATVAPDGPVSEPAIDLQVACEAPDLPDRAELVRWIAGANDAIGGVRQIEIAIRIVDESESQALNRQFRERDKSTNVLSFPADMESIPGLPPEASIYLGDLVLCAPVVAREAREQGKAASTHWLHLVLHGFLHLNGFDHETAEDAAEMEGLETRLMKAAGLPDPYKDLDSS